MRLFLTDDWREYKGKTQIKRIKKLIAVADSSKELEKKITVINNGSMANRWANSSKIMTKTGVEYVINDVSKLKFNKAGYPTGKTF